MSKHHDLNAPSTRNDKRRVRRPGVNVDLQIQRALDYHVRGFNDQMQGFTLSPPPMTEGIYSIRGYMMGADLAADYRRQQAYQESENQKYKMVMGYKLHTGASEDGV